MTKKPTGKAVGGHARANKLSPAQRKEIAKKGAEARWGGDKPVKQPAKRSKEESTDLRGLIVASVLCGLYSNLGDSQKFIGHFMAGVSLPEAFTRIAVTQAEETIRLAGL